MTTCLADIAQIASSEFYEQGASPQLLSTMVILTLHEVHTTLHGATHFLRDCSNFSVILPLLCRNIILTSFTSSLSASRCCKSRFMTLFNVDVYRRYIKDFSKNAKPNYELLEGPSVILLSGQKNTSGH